MLDLGKQHGGVLPQGPLVYGSPEAACALTGIDLDLVTASVSTS